jgi:NADPH:quinone reductase-like Zn-dependent oxidoreductase
MSTMQACVYEQYGPPDVVRVGQVALPVARNGELLIKVHAASVTTADWRFRASAFPSGFGALGRLMLGLFRPRNPVLGMDFSGTIVKTGEGVTRFRVGDAVFGSTSAMRRGAHAEYVAVAESGAIARKPPSLTHQEAAAIPFGGNAALAFMRDFGDVQPGQQVLVVGASGAVGSWAVQIARFLGATVTGVCSARNADLVLSLGARQVVDYTAASLVDTECRYDLIFDTVGVTNFQNCKVALTDKGVFLPLNPGLREIWQALLTARGRGKRVKFAVSENHSSLLETLLNLIETRAARPVVDAVYRMDQIAEAHRHVEGRHKRGSVLVTMHAAGGSSLARLG